MQNTSIHIHRVKLRTSDNAYIVQHISQKIHVRLVPFNNFLFFIKERENTKHSFWIFNSTTLVFSIFVYFLLRLFALAIIGFHCILRTWLFLRGFYPVLFWLFYELRNSLLLIVISQWQKKFLGSAACIKSPKFFWYMFFSFVLEIGKHSFFIYFLRSVYLSHFLWVAIGVIILFMDWR